ncbi:MAG: anhydro-N-acetylmuramic acid kinase, partial [Halioglobus sp.]
MSINKSMISNDTGSIDSSWAIGLMTGTVLDGYIDVALLKTDG